MQIPLEFSFRGVEESEEIKDLIRRRVGKLEHVCGYIVRCRVAVEMPHQHQRSGNRYRVLIEIKVPHRHDLVIRRQSGKGDMHDSLPAVLRKAFDAARRELKRLVDRQHREVKSHPETQAKGFVVRLYREEGYGFIEATDGREIYFHRNSVLQDDFARLEVGTHVRFVEEEGEKGPQASTVQMARKPTSRIAELAESE
jgi:cold shock CspA family protein